MRTIGYIILLIVLTANAAMAQPDRQKMERIRAIKVAYLTDKIHLTAGQAEKFWPVYRQYEDELFAARGGSFTRERKPHVDEEASRKSIEDDIAMQEKKLAIRKKYKTEFLQIISAQQLATLYDAEREFKKMLVQQLKDRHESKQLR